MNQRETMGKLKMLLDDACIDYHSGLILVEIDGLEDMYIHVLSGGLLKIYGCGYNGVFKYSPEYVVKMLDRKFREGTI